MTESIRIVVCGDEDVGKLSLITTLVKGQFVPNIQSVIPPVTISRDDYLNLAYDNLSESEGPQERRSKNSDLYNSNGLINLLKSIPRVTWIIDTTPTDSATLEKELKSADAIWLVYLGNYSYERVLLHWLLLFRLMGIGLPVIICANKSDLLDKATIKQQNAEEFLPLINGFKEIEACIRCSAKDNSNVAEAFYLCERAITHPVSPIFDAKDGSLKPDCVVALKRVFFLCDKDQDGILNYHEFSALHAKCFGPGSVAPESDSTASYKFTKAKFADILSTIAAGNSTRNSSGVSTRISSRNGSVSSKAPIEGVSEEGFLLLNKIYAEKGRHETIWGILRAFHYTDSLSLQDKFLFPNFDVPEHASVELGPLGYRFLVDLFLKFDKDNDGGLNDSELKSLLSPTPGIPKLWKQTQFPLSIVRNEQGNVTLQGWLAQWNLTTFLNHRTTLEYLAYLGYDEGKSVKALLVTKVRKRRQQQGKFYRQPVNDRNVFSCIVVGAPNSGKSSLLQLFLTGSYSEMYSPTIQPRICVKDIELPGGKQCYLILEELGELEPAILENAKRLDQCDVICYAYDSSDPELFQYLIDMREKYAAAQLDEIPAVFVALKADLAQRISRHKT